MDTTIEGLDELIKDNIGENKEIIQRNVTHLTAPGENYWSEMLKIDITLRNKENGSNEPLNVVAKCCITDEFVIDMNISMFKSEIMFYKEIVPTIQNFLKKRGVPELTFFPELTAARINLKDEGEPDKNAVLILENLISRGYENQDRHVGFDFDAAKILLTDLAVFHAVILAIKILEPETFEKKIKKNCVILKPPEPKAGEGPPQLPMPFKAIRETLLQNIFCRTHIDKFDNFVEIDKKKLEKYGMFRPDADGVFSTIVHNDMWVNNTMQILKNGKVLKNKFVDFQCYAVDNPANDLLFFLFSSVDVPTLRNHFDYLLTFYHEKLIMTLETVGCDTKPFAYKYFLQNLRNAANEKFLTIAMMNTMVIFAKKGHKTDFQDSGKLKGSDFHPIAKEKVCLMFTEMIKRDWL